MTRGLCQSLCQIGIEWDVKFGNVGRWLKSTRVCDGEYQISEAADDLQKLTAQPL
jgi:hypothetical protein